MATTQRLILASASEGRRDLLKRAGFQFEVIPSQVEEPDFREYTDPQLYVQSAAWLKARAVASRIERGLIIAADSISWQGGQGIGKPADEAEARSILQRLAGSRHHLWTGMCLWNRPGDAQVAWQEVSVVEMKALTQAELDAYVATGVWRGKAGAYAIQEQDDPFIHVVSGTISNVVGLPVESLVRILQLLGPLFSCPP
jgi:septum formation protein